LALATAKAKDLALVVRQRLFPGAAGVLAAAAHFALAVAAAGGVEATDGATGDAEREVWWPR